LPPESSAEIVTEKATPAVVLDGEATTNCVAGPGPVGKKGELVAEVSAVDAAVIVKPDGSFASSKPAKPQFVRFTTPDTACTVAHPAESIPPEVVKVIGAVDDVTILPPESSTFTSPAVKFDPDAPATGSVVKANWVGTPGTVGENTLLGADTTCG
jgi:hypothetical protein